MTGEVAVLVSGRGSNLRALVAAMEAGACRGAVRAVVADRPCAALGFAAERGIETRLLCPKDHPDRAAWDAALARAIRELDPALVVLAGFMRIVGGEVLSAYGGRIVNVHPSLLPDHPGLQAPRQALEAGAVRTGCTVHLVDAGVDTGPILAQAACPVRPDDTPDALHARIQPLEHALLPAVVDSLLRG